VIPTQIVTSIERDNQTPAQTQREFMNLVQSGAKMKVAGSARKDPMQLFKLGHKPKHRFDLFDTRFYLTRVRQVPELRFLVAYVVQPDRKGNPVIYPRIFYKDLSLAWRSASHYSETEEGIWVGKGDVRPIVEDGEEWVESVESTTDLPLEMQTAVDSLINYSKRMGGKESTLGLIIRRSPDGRVVPYRDFIEPRERAAANKGNLINRGKSVARFKKANDPTSLVFAKGFEPDFKKGILEATKSKSKLYGGTLKRFRILSVNQKIQYLFFAGRRHVWIIPPQATTTELSSYGVRTIDVVADDDLFIPGYEYHHYEENEFGEQELFSQIPPGFAGEVCELDDAKADASPWLDKIPIIQKFRRDVLR